MNDRYSNSNVGHRHALPLTPSKLGLAALLAFSAAHANADALPDADTTHRPADVAPTDAGNLAQHTTDAAVAPAVAASQPEVVEFDRDFLSGSGARNTDISRFNKGNIAPPGHYRAELYVNGVWIGVTDIDMRETTGEDRRVQPMFDRDLLMRAGVDFTRLTDTARTKLDDAGKTGGVPLSALIPQASASFDMGDQRLDVSIPQAMMSRHARGWVDPKFWDDGVPAATLQYNANLYHSSGNGFDTTQGYLGLAAGANVGPWRFRYNGNVTTSNGGGAHVQSIQTYLQRSFTPIKSQLTLGHSYTDGTIFDSFGVRGAQLGTDDRMYPESQRGYAPTVRGIANTNAKVEVKQNGNIIYTTTVAPGPFEINDLYPTGYGGDLQVVVTEADGSQHVSSVPYAAPVNALREGRWRYNVAAGQYRNSSVSSHPFVFQGQVQRGITNYVTVYGGAILGEDYYSGAVGAALNTPVGAFAADITQANSTLANQGSHSGQSLRIAYSRVFAPTDTNLTLAAYRYSTSGFLSYADAMNLRDLAQRGLPNTSTGIQKGRLQITINQNLNAWGSVYASGFTQNYWNRPNRDTSFQVGYNTNIRRAGITA
ncbi:Sigma-fimbriae usher protein [Candidatus Burkholderia verschuerenii]|uniref:Sigma-fimbriae usher protein n=1 Tax=Candidatus Burkholderia verschuerenii TaxID=242163 RepID=A0A0L0MCV5_9BURK|nr:Sigma-fimbriae usher protein [Candidatus Burkholderia verschuerenii]